MTAILGISAFYHDSAAALVVDGEVVAAAQEERFTRVKHDQRFPGAAVASCLCEAGLAPTDLDYIAFYDKPLLKFERLIETYLAFAPRGFRSFRAAMPTWLKDKLHLRRTIRQSLPGADAAKLVFPEHHESHAASAFFPSPFQDAAILTLDGVGEWSTATMGVGRANQIELTHEIRFPHSLGLLYSAFTYYCGFKVNSGEYKLMGLAPYGRPIYRDAILEHLIDVKPDGSFWIDMQYFDYCHGLTMTNRRFDDLFGGPPRAPESRFSQRHIDLAASVQSVTEEIVLRIGRHIHETTQLSRLAMAGGVALNCVANGRLLREGPFDDVWIQPAAGDAGGALGAALFVWHQLLEQPRTAISPDSQSGSYLGPKFTDDQIATEVAECPFEAKRLENESDVVAYAADLLESGKVVGWFQGRMEFGPRALGARSILADARSPSMQSTMNRKIKFRESFRPFAPCVLQEEAHQWFELAEGATSPYMSFVAPVANIRRLRPDADAPMATSDGADEPDMLARVNQQRSTIPAVTHVDYSARIQTTSAETNPQLHALLSEFHRRTGCPLLINTSMNVRGEPICCTPRDAIRCFAATEMDVLILGRHVLEKSAADRKTAEEARVQYLAAFQLD